VRALSAETPEGPPTRSSWLNQIETWFSILQNQSLSGGSFTTVAELQCIHLSLQSDSHTVRLDQEEGLPTALQKSPYHPGWCCRQGNQRYDPSDSAHLALPLAGNLNRHLPDERPDPLILKQHRSGNRV
jgi:hypothetical protein